MKIKQIPAGDVIAQLKAGARVLVAKELNTLDDLHGAQVFLIAEQPAPAAVESTGDLIRTCADCRHAYVPKHAKDDTVYCSEVNQMKTLSGYCDWFQEEK